LLVQGTQKRLWVLRSCSSRAIKTLFGERFVDAVTLVKNTELRAYQQVISSWEREHLLLNV